MIDEIHTFVPNRPPIESEYQVRITVKEWKSLPSKTKLQRIKLARPLHSMTYVLTFLSSGMNICVCEFSDIFF